MSALNTSDPSVHPEGWKSAENPVRLNVVVSPSKCTVSEYNKCIVCGELIWWPSNSKLPPACGKHSYEDVFEMFEPTMTRAPG